MKCFCKIADVFDYLDNGIDHSTITGIAARWSAPASLMGLTPAQMVQAIGITVGGNTATRPGPRRRAVELEGLCGGRRLPQGDVCDRSLRRAA